MFTTFLLTAVLSTLVTVALSATGIYLLAEARWRHHPLASRASLPPHRLPY
ncbi:hypothetical protein ACIPLR_06495 [Herbaspirillum huttiense]|jgi:hypothetical protein|uniref:Uncharacterized protein n=2 Tax=Herbaspirillum huttiense TaxID=863372 RepID=A0AAJ2LQJ2_9BURK|nr:MULTISPECIES: hypothetical protein [Herbaspirillum]MBN9359099.1 hypothetical protein [Herbaspirillum huttiense]MDR9835772.1 hypothetical protein [Herbaspirillum huttiense]MEE1636971.1 hypothetical protein [Herbaspirillum huttiense NC40101]|tara:strand:+ start:3524 stop:3676 length:153 start_codon:yes stop_codon:yes gene_type:complete